MGDGALVVTGDDGQRVLGEQQDVDTQDTNAGNARPLVCRLVFCLVALLVGSARDNSDDERRRATMMEARHVVKVSKRSGSERQWIPVPEVQWIGKLAIAQQRASRRGEKSTWGPSNSCRVFWGEVVDVLDWLGLFWGEGGREGGE